MKALICTALVLSACGSSHTAQGARSGATRGAIAGAAGGLLTALVFGGDPAEAAARGATWGAGSGAAAGAMSGAQRDKAEKDTAAAKEKKRVDAEIAKLKKRIGEDCFAGLVALVDGKYKVAIAYAETASQSRNKDHRLAAVWLTAIMYVDSGDQMNARALYPEIVKLDSKISIVESVEARMAEAIKTLAEIRQKHLGA